MKMTGAIKACLIASALIIQSSVGEAQERYQRASLTQMMIEHPMYVFNDEIVAAFKEIQTGHRFNNHDLGVKSVKFATQEFTDQVPYINSFIRKSRIGSRAVAKWFCWNKNTGAFSTDLIKQRGVYNANSFDREMARLMVRGSSILEDAGENLLPHTYLIMHDICFKGNYSNRAADFDRAGQKVAFEVQVTSYIYSLDWNIDVLDEFYGRFYSAGDRDFIKNSEYTYTFRSKVSTSYGESSTRLSQRQLIKQVVARTLDMNIAKLQTQYAPFRIRVPLRATSPIIADIGLKEGITPDSRFEILEAEIDSDGIAHYTRAGVVRPIAGKIADNRYSELPEQSAESYTEFEIISGSDFYEGMLLREIDR